MNDTDQMPVVSLLAYEHEAERLTRKIKMLITGWTVSTLVMSAAIAVVLFT